jgi:endonuclease/exonuclease/phosphatase family metal-dependent hydrolase
MRMLLVFLMAGLGIAITGCRSTAQSNSTIRVMTWNIHHGEGMDKRVDIERIAKLIRQEGADVVALQEVDKGVDRTQRRDLSAEIAALTHMSVVFSNNYAFQGGEYGNAILSRYPVLSTENLHYQKVNETEQRGLLKAVLDVNGIHIAVFNTHLDHRRPDAARWSNVSEIENAVSPCGSMPVIVCGDFNSPPEGRVYERLSKTFDDCWEIAGNGEGFTIPSEHPNRRIDYIWIRKNRGVRAIKAAVPESLASDHRPLVVAIKLAKSD